MSNTKKAERRAVGKQQSVRRRRSVCCLVLAAFCLLAVGCRMDMQDQPRYEYYEPSRFFADGQGSRPLVEGTVPRGAQFRDPDQYLYSGKMTPGGGQTGATAGASGGGQAGGGQQQQGTGGAVDLSAQAPGATGGVGAGAANLQSSGMGGAQATGDVNVRGNVAGGIPAGAGNMGAGNPAGAGGAGGARPAGGVPGGNASPTGGPDIFPIVLDEAALARGRERFNIYCAMCHGMTGEGDGMIVRRGFRRPPSFHSEQLQPGTASAAHVFDVITNGWGAMPSYSDSIPVEDRWKIIAYLRALQLSRRERIENLPAHEQQKLRTKGQATGAEHGGSQH